MEVSQKHKRRRRKSNISCLNTTTTNEEDKKFSNICYCCHCRCCCSQLKQSASNQAKMISLRSYQFKKSILFTLVMILTFIAPILLAAFALSSPSTTNHQQIILLETSTSNNNTRQTPSLASASNNNNNSPNQQHAHLLASFSTPNQAINITHVTYDPLYDTVYLGATNAIYQLNGSDLKEQFEQTTGPVYDNPSCGITECNGYEDFMKPTQNVNKILVIDYQHKKLLSCGSTKQGACRRYQLNNIAQKEDLISMAVAANDDNSSTYAFIAPARYTYDPSQQQTTSSAASMNGGGAGSLQQQVLYVAATYTKVGPSRDLLVPAIGTRTLDEGPNLLKLYENSFVDNARIDINSHLRDYFLVNYLYGFASSNYIYFVTVQKKATSRDYEELGYHTRLARICITDSSYNSYTEVDLKCMPNNRGRFTKQANGLNNNQPTEYPLLQDAILVDAGSQLLQSLAQNDQSSPTSGDFFFNNPSSGSGSADDSKVLLGVFSSARDHTQHAGEHSALCAFSLSQIEDKFNDNIHNCYTGKMQSRNMEYIAGNVQECPKSGQGGNVVNFCHETLKINGTLPIVSEASIQYHNTTLTAITATSHVETNLKNIYGDILASNLASTSNFSSKSTTSKSFITNPSLSFSSQNIANQQQQEQQHTVVFMGTSNGRLKKVLLNNASNGIEFEEVQLDTNPILSDIHLHSSGQQIIAATPYKVMKIPIHNCGQYSTCKECSQSKNPYCGWCSLRSSCTTKSECISSGSDSQQQQQSSNGGQQRNSPLASESSTLANNKHQFKWISTESAGKCIDLQSIVPDKIPITSTGKLDLYIDRLPRLPKEHSYKCIFDWKEQTIATQQSFGLSCPLPKVMHRPKIQHGKDHATVDLAVRSSETNVDSLSGKITFFDCQLHTTCKDCLSTNWGCNWCLNENICLFNTSKCERTGASQLQPQSSSGSRQDNSLVQFVVGGPRTGLLSSSLSLGSAQRRGAFASSIVETTTSTLTERSANTVSSVGQCPMFDLTNSGGQQGQFARQEILIPDGSEKELTIKVRNMPHYKANIQCVVEIENEKTPLKARIEDDSVICENLTYTYGAQVGSLVGQLMLVYSDSGIWIDKLNLTLYKCHLLGANMYQGNRPDCSLCQLTEPRFNCVWCSGGCNLRKRCHQRPEDVCPETSLIQQLSIPHSSGKMDLSQSFMSSAPSWPKMSTEGTDMVNTQPQGYEEISFGRNANEMINPAVVSGGGGGDLLIDSNSSNEQLNSFMRTSATSSTSSGLWTTIILVLGVSLLVVSIAAFVMNTVGRAGSQCELERKKRGSFFGSSNSSSGVDSHGTTGPIAISLEHNNLIDTEPIVDCNQANTGTNGTETQSISIIDLPQSAYLGYTTQRIYAAGSHLPPIEVCSGLNVNNNWSRATHWLRRPTRWLTLAFGSSASGPKVGQQQQHHHNHRNTRNTMNHRIVNSSLTNPSSFSTCKSQYHSGGYSAASLHHQPAHPHSNAHHHQHQQQTHHHHHHQQNARQLPLGFNTQIVLGAPSSSTSSYVSSSNYYEEIGSGNLTELNGNRTSASTNPRASHTIIDPFKRQHHDQQQFVGPNNQIDGGNWRTGAVGGDSSLLYSVGDQRANSNYDNPHGLREHNNNNNNSNKQLQNDLSSQLQQMQHNQFQLPNSPSTNTNSQHPSSNMHGASATRHYLFASLSAVDAYKNSLGQQQEQPTNNQVFPDYNQPRFMQN